MQYSMGGLGAFLMCACALSLLCSVVARLSTAWGATLTYVAFSLYSAAAVLLTYLRVTDHFNYAHVYQNSHTTQPLLYKVCGIWGNYEGSNLLFVWMLSAYGTLIALLVKRDDLKGAALVVQNLLSFGFALFGVIFANPFLEVITLDADGLGFNPMLQDVGLALHPPVLFGGYTGFGAVFSITIAALVLRIDPKEWVAVIRGWVLGAWTLLTLGVALGGWWAYRELGWGGFWSWDPVENVSLMPWFLGVALIHMMPVVKKFGIYCNFTFLLALLAFISSLCGTFLVRSGFLVSVHAFANDQGCGIFLLALVTTITVGGLLTFVIKYRNLPETCCHFGCISKLTAILANSVIMLTAFLVVLAGTVYPIILELLEGDTISVGAPYYNNVFSVLSVALFSVMILLSGLSWDGSEKFKMTFKISSVIATLLVPFAAPLGLTGVLILLAALLFFSILEDYIYRVRSSQMRLSAAVRRVSLGRYAMMMTHAGVAVCMFGIICSTAFQEDVTQYMKERESAEIHGFSVTLSGVSLVKRPHNEAIRAKFSVARSGKVVCLLFPESRFYYVEGIRNSESSICHGLLADIYIVVGEVDKNRGIAVQMHYKPLINLVWAGFALMAAGGVLSVVKVWLRRRQNNPAIGANSTA
ncbi:heme lyase CcmF/NrfE family subunit [Anaplasma marginale]|uniref:heme lyase CcmF/NrfE family subunit n=1 Tax=Anaplasma marginale TaxID=770 RepID=UPI000DEFCA60|nr:heme lyase CcmF/NrfE family subunit [Anaplasma marginale]RCL19390.1 heme lyase CcmF/NrfE family subunit [Anaplasma marginale]